MEANLMLAGSTALIGAASGLLALFTVRKQQRAPQPKPEQHTVAVELVDFPVKLEEAFASALEKHQATPPVIDLPEPDWHKEMLLDMTLASERMTAAANRPQLDLQPVVAELVRIGGKLDELLELPPAQPVDESLDLQKKLVQRMAEAIEPLAELPNQLSTMMQRWSTSGNVTVTTAPPLMLGGGGGGLPSPRKASPTPFAAPPAPVTSPTVPAPYVGGSVVVPAGQPTSLLGLIQQQLQPNCPGSSAELVISADEAIYVGSASALGGPLSATNYAYELTPGAAPRIYRSSFPGNSTPLADLQVFAAAAATLHVEVTT